MLPPCVAYYYPEATVLGKQISACSKCMSQGLDIFFCRLFPANFVVVRSVMPVAKIWRRSYNCSKFHAS
jgi:hypothetical protein